MVAQQVLKKTHVAIVSTMEWFSRAAWASLSEMDVERSSVTATVMEHINVEVLNLYLAVN